MFGVDLSVGKYKDNYEDFVIVNLEKSDIPYENNSFSSVMISHVVEHINDTSNLVSNLKRLVTNHNSEKIPSISEFNKVGFNFRTTLNFFDDKTHIRPYSYQELGLLFIKSDDFKILNMGSIYNKYLGDTLISYAIKEKDNEIFTYGMWLKYIWCDYIVLEKI